MGGSATPEARPFGAITQDKKASVMPNPAVSFSSIASTAGEKGEHALQAHPQDHAAKRQQHPCLQAGVVARKGVNAVEEWEGRDRFRSRTLKGTPDRTAPERRRWFFLVF